MLKVKNRECTVCVTSCQIDAGGEKQTMETESKGQLSEREGILYVLYEENAGETPVGNAVVKNLLKIEKEEHRVSLKKSGAVFWKIMFEQGKKDTAEYGTPYGTLRISVDTKTVMIEETEQKTSLQIAYALIIQGEKQADCRLEIEIR